MSDAAQILDELLDALNAAGKIDGFDVWTEVGPARWEEASKKGAATAYIEITTPGEELADVAHLVALPEAIPVPVFDDGAAADRAHDAQVDRELGVTP